MLEQHYRGAGWKVQQREDCTVRAAGLDGVTWIGLPMVAADLSQPGFGQLLLSLADTYMPDGRALCPLDLLPDPPCADELRALLDELRLRGLGHVEIYSLAA